MSRSVGIVIPAYRPDLDRLAEYIDEIVECLEPDSLRIEWDEPDDLAVQSLSQSSATIATSTDRRGKGAAITAGFERLYTDVLAFADADGSTPASSLQEVIRAVQEGPADLAVGSRRHTEAVVADPQSRVRGCLGEVFAWLARRVLPVSLADYQCGAKAISAEGWERIRCDIFESGFAWDVNVVDAAGRHGLPVQEVPIHWVDRPGSTVPPLRTTVELGWALLRIQRRRLVRTPRDRPVPDLV